MDDVKAEEAKITDPWDKHYGEWAPVIGRTYAGQYMLTVIRHADGDIDALMPSGFHVYRATPPERGDA